MLAVLDAQHVEREALNAQGRKLERTIAANMTGILGL